MWSDLREYLDALERDGLFKWVAREVTREEDIGCISRLLFRGVSDSKRVGVGFSNIRGYPGMRVAIGAIGASISTLAKILGVEPERTAVYRRWSEALANPIEPCVVRTGPCKENIMKGNEVDLSIFPAPIWLPGRDAGPYLTPLWITKDPTTGVRNVGMYRAQVKGKTTTGIQWGRPDFQHAAQHLAKWEQLGQPMPAAMVIGGAPSLYLPAVTKLPYGLDELAVAGGVQREPVELVRCETIDIEVPATAEIVVEGEFRLGVREPEGPFGEFTGYMTSSEKGEPVFDVKCVTYRNSPILLGMMSQMPPSESSICRQLLSEGAILHHLTRELRLPGIVDVHLPASGGAGAMLWISVCKPHASFPLQVAMAVWGRFGFLSHKWIVVVDDDINIRDAFAREWTLAYRVRPEKDIYCTPEVGATTLDPSATLDPTVPSRERTGTKLFIDATKKYEGFPEVALPPVEYLEHTAARWGEYGLPPLDMEWRALRR